jgi:hypothetical protein
MKNKLRFALVLVAGLLLGGGITEAINYYEVYVLYNRLLAVDDAQLKGWTLIEQQSTVAAVPAAQPTGAQVAEQLLAAFGGRKLSALASALSAQQPAQPQAQIRVAFIVPGKFRPMATPGAAGIAYYQNCDRSVNRCTDPAIIPPASEAQP